MEFPDTPKLEPGKAEIRIELMKSGANRFIVRGPDGIFFDWIMDNTERQSVIHHLLLSNEQIVVKRWWHRLAPLELKPLITPLER